MRFVVFGASGRCGGHFVRLAAARSHHVTAVTRRDLENCPPGVTSKLGNVLDAGFVRDVVAGHDAVMSGLGMRYAHPWARRESADDFTSRATAHIIEGMRAAGLRRLSVISAAGVGDSRAGLNMIMRFLLATSNVGVAYADLERVEQALAASALDWQAVRPTTLSSRRATGRPRITDRFPMWASIPREDVAAFMLTELERPQFTARSPVITAPQF